MIKKRLFQAAASTLLYLMVANIGNHFFQIDRQFSWITTLWEAFFFFLFMFLLLGYRRPK